MSYTQTEMRFTPEFTPRAVRNIIFTTIFLTLFSALLEPVFFRFFGISGPQEWFSLSWYNGLSYYLLWQPVTYLFVLSQGYDGISLNLLLALAFQMYFLWIVGTTVYNRVGSEDFLKVYFLTGIGSGLIASFIAPHYIFSGPAPSLLALLTLWMFLEPENEIYLLLTIPIKIKWLTLGTLGAIALIYLSSLEFVYFTFYLLGPLIAYLFATFVWHLESPFPWMNHLGKKTRLKKSQTAESAKVLKFKTGQPDIQSDDRFIDAMLVKISKFGESSLTWSERRRMDKIAKKKASK